jgi:hypothetical protein
VHFHIWPASLAMCVSEVSATPEEAGEYVERVMSAASTLFVLSHTLMAILVVDLSCR